MDHDRNPEPVCGGIGRRRGIATEADDHLGALVLKVLHHLGLLSLPFAGEFQRRTVGSAGERHLLYRLQLVPGLWHQIGLQPHGRSQRDDVGVGVEAPNRVGHGEQRIDVACGATTRKHDAVLCVRTHISTVLDCALI